LSRGLSFGGEEGKKDRDLMGNVRKKPCSSALSCSLSLFPTLAVCATSEWVLIFPSTRKNLGVAWASVRSRRGVESTGFHTSYWSAGAVQLLLLPLVLFTTVSQKRVSIRIGRGTNCFIYFSNSPESFHMGYRNTCIYNLPANFHFNSLAVVFCRVHIPIHPVCF
jgi:hypothetical protein